MADLRSKLIRLAHAHPELRGHLLPLLVEEPRSERVIAQHGFSRVGYQQEKWTTRVYASVKADGFALQGKKFTFSGSADIRLEVEGRFIDLDDDVQYKAEAQVPDWKASLKITGPDHRLLRFLIRETLKIKAVEGIEYELSKLGVKV